MQIDNFLIHLQCKNKTLIINFIKKIMAKGGGSTKTVSASNASASRQNSKINESVLD